MRVYNANGRGGITLLVLLAAMAFGLLVACTAVVFAEGQPGAVASHEVPAGTRTVQPLAGDFPVGRWECWFEPKPLADIAASNTPIVPIRCEVYLLAPASVIELLPDTSPHGNMAWALALKTPGTQDTGYTSSGVFTVAGSGNLYARVEEARWSVEPVRDWRSCSDPRADACLVILTTRTHKYAMYRLGQNAMRLTDTYYGTRRLMFRAGSTQAAAMQRFRDCVKGNDRQPLFKLVQCESPLHL